MLEKLAYAGGVLCGLLFMGFLVAIILVPTILLVLCTLKFFGVWP